MSCVEHLAEGVTLYLGDCREILPGLGMVDAVVTDPPYGIDYGRAGSFSASHGWGPWRENVSWDLCPMCTLIVFVALGLLLALGGVSLFLLVW
jgi:hypothetical protein